MDYLTLPIDLNSIETIDFQNTMIDMSDLRFPCSPEHKVRSAYIFIRNIDLNMNFDFSKCSYDAKEEFVLMYLRGNIKVNIPIITNTWMDILISNYIEDIVITGIFTHDEIDLFYKKNSEFIDEVNKLIASLVVMGIYQYSKSNASGAEMIQFDGEFEETDYDEINFNNFSYLTSAENFGCLLQASEKFTPRFYKKYFDGNDQMSMARINTNLPIINLLNIFFGPTEIQDNFIDRIDEILTPEEVPQDE